MVLHIGMQYNVKLSIGIEYSKERYQCSLDLQKEYAQDYNNIKFFNKDCFNYNLDNATVIYIDNTMFTYELLYAIYNKIPKGCLFIYASSASKSSFLFNNQIEKAKGTHRTYKANQYFYIIKK